MSAEAVGAGSPADVRGVLCRRDLRGKARQSICPLGCRQRNADDAFFDARRSRLYVICGAGAVDVIGTAGYRRLARIATRPGARMELDRLFLAARASDSGLQAAALRTSGAMSGFFAEVRLRVLDDGIAEQARQHDRLAQAQRR
jgi:hypothetical protein